MDTNPKIKEYSDRVPPEMRALIRGLSSSDRLGILVALLKNGEMTFRDLKEGLGLPSGSLSGHLTALQDGFLVENFYKKGGGRFSYYDATDASEAVFKALFGALYGPPSGPAGGAAEAAPVMKSPAAPADPES